MDKIPVTKIVAIFVVVLFLGMIASGAFSGNGKKEVKVNYFGLTEYNPRQGKGELYLKIQNNENQENMLQIVLELNKQKINSTQLTLNNNQTKELTFDFRFMQKSDNLVFKLKNEEGRVMSQYGTSVVQYPRLSP